MRILFPELFYDLHLEAFTQPNGRSSTRNLLKQRRIKQLNWRKKAAWFLAHYKLVYNFCESIFRSPLWIETISTFHFCDFLLQFLFGKSRRFLSPEQPVFCVR